MHIASAYQKTHQNTLPYHKMRDHLWWYHWHLVITAAPSTQTSNQYTQSCMKCSCMCMKSFSAPTSSNTSSHHSLPCLLLSLCNTLWCSATVQFNSWHAWFVNKTYLLAHFLVSSPAFIILSNFEIVQSNATPSNAFKL